MIKFIYLITTLLLVSAGVVRSQTPAVIKFTDTSCYETARPMLLTGGQQVLIQCDTVYLINKTRFRLYEKARHFILDTDILKYQTALEEYEVQLNKADEAYKNIYQKYLLMSGNYEKDLKTTNSDLKNVRSELSKAQSEVKSASEDLEKLRKKLSAERWKSLGTKLLYGVGGAVIGITILSLIN